MDISILQASAYDLPTSRRVGVIVHDGTTDLRIWRGPGPDKDLLFAYGEHDLLRLLDGERARAGGAVPIGTVLRLHPGRLHCDFLLWIATRPPEQAGIQAPAPDATILEAATRDALAFVSTRDVLRVAFPALGAGPSAIPDAERMALIARACSDYYEGGLAEGRANPIEEVVICDPRLSVTSAARKLTSKIAKAPEPERPSVRPIEKPEKKERGAGTRGAGTRRPASAPSRARKPTLDAGDIAYARANARPWERERHYRVGDFFLHAKFGVGRVEEITPDQFAVVLFEDGSVRRLVHAS